MRKNILLTVFFCFLICFTGCSKDKMPENVTESKGSQKEEASDIILQQTKGAEDSMQTHQSTETLYTVDTPIAEVIEDPVFENYGRLIFPVDEGYYRYKLKNN